MTFWRLIAKEILHRRLNFALGVASVFVAVGSLTGALTVLRAHDLHTQAILDRKEAETKRQMAALEDEVRKAMLKLGFNVVILPKDQNLSDWYADDYGSKCMPEAYADRLAASPIVTIQHLLPSLQQRITWPEQKRTIILVGTRGEMPSSQADARKPLAEPVPAGSIVLGHELHTSLGLEAGDAVSLLGREFRVSKCQAPAGNKDDITAWINLKEAQELLDKPGLINAILALECHCALADVGKVREEITRVLPDTQVVEQGSQALARAEARAKVGGEAAAALDRERQNGARLRGERERLASILVPIVMVAAAAGIAFLSFANARERRPEVAVLRAVGVRSRQILLVFLARAVAVGVAGGVLGLLGGAATGRMTAVLLDSHNPPPSLLDARMVLAGLVLAPALAALASWLPALFAAHQDPADVLREE